MSVNRFTGWRGEATRQWLSAHAWEMQVAMGRELGGLYEQDTVECHSGDTCTGGGLEIDGRRERRYRWEGPLGRGEEWEIQMEREQDAVNFKLWWLEKLLRLLGE